MIQSMTGFAERSFTFPSFTLKVSIRTLNHRYFDWNYRGFPIREVESRLRAFCKKRIHRGRVEVSLDVSFSDAAKWEICINHELLAQVLSSVDKAAENVLRNVSLSIDNLFNIPHVLEMKRKDFNEEEILFLEKCFVRTLEDLVRVRRREGRELKKEIQDGIRRVHLALKRLEKYTGKQPELIRKKMRERLRELNDGTSLSEERILEEASLFALRYDLNEEMTRLKSHLGFFRELLASPQEEPVGRQMDFVTQELFRETNTISSKSQYLAVSKECLTIKGELESIRQQVQNIE
ncbi:MAG: YicC family protein [Candidatus Aminicenantes bacterium]|nr:YicC family protein [Candidatus Aminicenantes bacterium]